MPTELIRNTEPINEEEHKGMLDKIDSLQLGDEHASVYRASLEELFAKLNSQLKEIVETIKAYREVVDLINKRQPLADKKKYVRVHFRNGNKRSF